MTGARPTAEGDWRKVGECGRCRAPVLAMRRGPDAARQEEHRDWCRALARRERMERKAE